MNKLGLLKNLFDYELITLKKEKIVKNNSSRYLLIDFVKLNLSFKQFITVLKECVLKKKYIIRFILLDEFLRDYIFEMIKEYKLEHIIFIDDCIDKVVLSKDDLTLIILIEGFCVYKNKNLFNKFKNSSNILVVKINCKLEFNSLSNYKIFGKLDSFKSMVYLLSVIITIFK